MQHAIADQSGDEWLSITGVRIGESAARDERIVLSCSRDGAECGQGHFFQSLTNTLAPIVHWRVCHVWEWLKHWAPLHEYGDWVTAPLADAYGGDEAEEINARTGCICCPLASNDKALDTILSMPRWNYLRPLKYLRDIYHEMRSPLHRLRQPGTQRRRDGTIPKNPNRMGPLTIEARMRFFAQIDDIQNRINADPDCHHPRDAGLPLARHAHCRRGHRRCDRDEHGERDQHASDHDRELNAPWPRPPLPQPSARIAVRPMRRGGPRGPCQAAWPRSSFL